MSTASRRRAAWSTTAVGPGLDGRERLLVAASRCLARDGVAHTSISAVAREAGVSRQTVYAYFDGREVLVRDAIEYAAGEASERIVGVARRQPTVADFLVELCVLVVDEFRANPAIAPMLGELGTAAGREEVLSEHSLAMARSYLRPVLDYDDTLEPRLDEIAETVLRFELSLFAFTSSRTATTEARRDYLRRTMVPALGVDVVKV